MKLKFLFRSLAIGVMGWSSGGAVEPSGEDIPPVVSVAKLNIAPEDILETKERDLENRKIILQKITPVELPPLPEPAARVDLSPEQRAARLALRQGRKEQVLLMLSVTMLRSESFPGGVRTRIRWKPKGRTEECEVVSNIEGKWLGGIANFETVTRRYSLYYFPGDEDIDRKEAMFAAKGRPYQRPVVPEIAAGEPAFVITQGTPTAEDLAPIHAIHELMRTQGESLRQAHEAREAARKQREEYARTHPEQPKDLVLRYWRVEKVAVPTGENGGAR